MKQDQTTYKFPMIILIIICFIIPPLITIAQTAQIVERAVDYYKPDSWPKSTQPPVMGFGLDNYSIPGFKLKEKRYFAPTKGTCYIWYNDSEQLELWIVVNVYVSAEAAHGGMFNWLATGTTALIERGTLSSKTELIGDISWADPNFSTLLFARDNVVVLVVGLTKKENHRQLIDDIASLIDDEIKTKSRTATTSEPIEWIRPIIETISLEESKLRVNEKVKLTVVASDPRDEMLRYGYYATGGNILRTKEGVFYQAIKPGIHKIVVTVINEANISTEETLSVTVLE